MKLIQFSSPPVCFYKSSHCMAVSTLRICHSKIPTKYSLDIHYASCSYEVQEDITFMYICIAYQKITIVK